MILIVETGGNAILKNYRFTKSLPILSIMIPVAFIVLFAVVYPKEINAQNVKSSLTIDEDLITIRLDYIYPFEKFYDYQVEFDNNIFKIYVQNLCLQKFFYWGEMAYRYRD